MLEAVILDTTERLLAASGFKSELSASANLISSPGQMVCLARSSKAAYPFSGLANFAANNGNFASWLSTQNNVLLVSDTTASVVMAVNLTSGAMSADSSGRTFAHIQEDASGAIWANATNAGQYGLWRRTGAGAWTQVLADVAATNYLYRMDDGKIYWNSSAGNWYECTAGTAVVTTDPRPGQYLPRARSAGWETNDAVGNYAFGYSHGLTGLGVLPATAGYFEAAAEQNAARYWPMSASGQSSGTMVPPIGNINWEMLAECTQPNIINASTDLHLTAGGSNVHRLLRLDNTYTLHVAAVKLNTTSSTRPLSVGGRKLVLTILNKTSGVNKYIGSLYLTASSTDGITATTSAAISGNIIGASLNTGVLDLWIAQGTYTTAVASDVYGLFKKSMSLNLDF